LYQPANDRQLPRNDRCILGNHGQTPYIL
jgi:hypothetical protein